MEAGLPHPREQARALLDQLAAASKLSVKDMPAAALAELASRQAGIFWNWAKAEPEEALRLGSELGELPRVDGSAPHGFAAGLALLGAAHFDARALPIPFHAFSCVSVSRPPRRDMPTVFTHSWAIGMDREPGEDPAPWRSREQFFLAIHAFAGVVRALDLQGYTRFDTARPGDVLPALEARLGGGPVEWPRAAFALPSRRLQAGHWKAMRACVDLACSRADIDGASSPALESAQAVRL